jgi:ferric-dicitrate binding protein FerR (iron transport regulator)
MKFKQNKKNLDSLNTDESFQLWISGNGTKTDNEKWKKWLNDHPYNKVLYNEALKIWQAGQFRSHSLPDVQIELNKLLDNLNLNTDKTETTKKNSHPTILQMNKRRFWKIGAAVISAAAILLIMFRLNISLPNNPFGEKYATVATKFSERTKLNLADGSTVILNGNSTLKYPADFTSETKRELYLKGEAYFEVTKKPIGPQHNFTVATDEGLITVIGTRFTVNSRKNQTKVALIQGRIKVMVKEKSDDRKISASVIMRPGEFLHFGKNAQNLNPQNNISPLQTSWWKDRLILNHTSMKEVITWLKETYGVDVEIKDDRLLKRTITGSIENNNLNFIVETLGKVLQVPVSIKGNTVIFETTNI